ncbi:hypothetical protein GCM10027168_50900 [Streptomyces capparidis]
MAGTAATAAATAAAAARFLIRVLDTVLLVRFRGARGVAPHHPRILRPRRKGCTGRPPQIGEHPLGVAVPHPGVAVQRRPGVRAAAVAPLQRRDDEHGQAKAEQGGQHRVPPGAGLAGFTARALKKV